MALTSVFYDGVVTESTRAKHRAGVPDYGVYGKDDFKVVPHPSIPFAVLVTKGRAHGWGVTDEAVEDQVVNCPSNSTGTRWDLIVVRRNWQPLLGGPSTLEPIPSGANPEIPEARKVGPGVEDDQPIAFVRWSGSLSAPAEIIDMRCWAANGGMVAASENALDYLNRIGARVKVGANMWSWEVNNGVEDWVKTPPAPTVKAGKVTVPIGAGASFATKAVTFPEAFASAPTVAVSLSSNIAGEASRLGVAGYGETTTGFTVKIQTNDNLKIGVSYNIVVSWTAVL